MTPSNVNFNNIQYNLQNNINNITNDIHDWFSSYLEQRNAQSGQFLGSSLPSLRQISLHVPFDELEKGTDGFNEINRVGSGSFGNVYKGKLRDGTFVAIKLITQMCEGSGFEEEVQVLSRFRHPNLVILMGFSREAKRCALIYEFLEGGDSANRLAKCRSQQLEFTAKQRITVLLDCAMGLSHMHNSQPKAFHRDIKTANILLDKNGGAKMADFGLSCVSKGSDEKKVEHVSGTIGYACPHYIRTGIVTESAEIYSFGMVILEFLTGRAPALQGRHPGEFTYLLDDIKGKEENVIRMLDPNAMWPPGIAQALCTWAFKCSLCPPQQRTNFIETVTFLRSLVENIESDMKSVTPAPVTTYEPPEYQVGAKVIARWKETFIEFKGVIIKVNLDDTCTIQYEDQEVEHNVPFDRIKVVERAPAPKPLPPTPAPVPVPRPVKPAVRSPVRAPSRQDSAVASEDVSKPPRQTKVPRDTLIDVNDAPRKVVAGVGKSAPSRRPPLVEEGDKHAVYSIAGMPRGWTCRLRCTYPDTSIILWVESKLVIGRMAHPVGLWEELLTAPADRSTVSREHFEIRAHADSFFLHSRSQNGTLLNDELLRGKSERQLWHGDIVSLTSKADASAPFLSFIFESRTGLRDTNHHLADERIERLLCRSPSSQGGSPAVSGRWVVGPNEQACRNMDLFCLEVHGDPSAVRNLDASQRQISFASDVAAEKMPALRIGAFQARFWEKVLAKSWSTVIASEHFEIKPYRLTNPMLNEPVRWSYVLKVLEPITLNRSLELGVGEEQRLTSGDTLTFPRGESKIHITFIDFTYIPPEELAESIEETDLEDSAVQKIRASMLDSRRLPELGLLDDDETGVPETEATLTTANTEALRPPVHIERAEDIFQF